MKPRPRSEGWSPSFLDHCLTALEVTLVAMIVFLLLDLLVTGR